MYKLKIQENKNLSKEEDADYSKFKYASIIFSSCALAVFLTYTQKTPFIVLAAVLLLISFALLFYKQVQLKQYKDFAVGLFFMIISITTAILFLFL